MATEKRRMQPCIDTPKGRSLLELPDETVLGILRNLDATSLVALERTAKFFTRKDSVSKLPLTEHVAREQVIDRCGGDEAIAQRFRHITWKERLYLEDQAGCGFDREFCTTFTASVSDARLEPTVRLAGMGPKLLLSDVSTADQPVLRWRLRVRGNTAVEFGVIPLASTKSNIALHKCLEAGPRFPGQRCMGFSSQITAGSLLPFKAPVMRGTVVDMVVRRGRLEVVLTYPPDAKEITWEGGQPVSRPYRGPAEVRFEQDWSPAFDVRLGVTSWAKGCFDVLHTGSNAAEWAAGAVATAVPAAAPAAPAPPPAKVLRPSPSAESLPEATGDAGCGSGTLTRASSGTNVAGAADAAAAEGECPPGALEAALRTHAS